MFHSRDSFLTISFFLHQPIKLFEEKDAINIDTVARNDLIKRLTGEGGRRRREMGDGEGEGGRGKRGRGKGEEGEGL